MNKFALFIISLILFPLLHAQEIKPGLNPEEMKMILNISAHQFDSSKWKNYSRLPELPNNFQLSYRSPERGMDNRWDLFTNENFAVISVRGSVGSASSWLENFYAAMIPAEGSIQLPDSTHFEYKLANHSQALVHVGWTIGLGSMANDVVSKINEYHAKGYRNFYIVGYSQGASIAQLLRSYLHYLPKGKIPEDILFKTYAFACPKPGNYFYSCDYSLISQGGWEFRIINMEDWVPQMPFTVQRIEDMPEVNPFNAIDRVFKSVKPIQRMFLKSIYNKFKRKIDRAQKQLTKTLGTLVGKFLSKRFKGIEKLDFSESFDYYPAGTNIILQAAEVPDSLTTTQKIFFHHLPLMYYDRVKADFGLED